jgi:hypothetical protein
MTKTLPVEPEQLRAQSSNQAIGVDREQQVIKGYVVAELGAFKSEGRGEFTVESLKEIVRLGNKKAGGLKSRFTHPNLSNDGLGKHLGRSKNFVLADNDTKVRADLFMNPTAMREPPSGGRPLGDYVMQLAETDKGAISSSLVLQVEREYRLNDDGTRKRDSNGNALPPIWKPLELQASDIVDTGDAVNDLLSPVQIDGLPDALVRQASTIVDEQFLNEPRETVRSRCLSFIERYLANRFGEEEPSLDESEGESMSEKDKDANKDLSDKFDKLLGVVDKLSTTIAEDREDRKQQIADAEEQKTLHAKITEKCQMANCPKLASKFIEEGLSLEQVTDRLFEKLAATRPGTDGDADDTDETDEAKLGKDYDADIEIHRQLMMPKEEYQKVSQKLNKDGSFTLHALDIVENN